METEKIRGGNFPSQRMFDIESGSMNSPTKYMELMQSVNQNFIDSIMGSDRPSSFRLPIILGTRGEMDNFKLLLLC